MRKLNLFIAGRTLSTGGFVGSQVLIAIQAGRGTVSSSALVLFLVLSLGVQFLALPIAGVLTDRMVRSTASAGAYLLQAVVLIALAVGLANNINDVALCVVAGALLGLSLAVNQPALSGLLVEIVGSGDLQTANGKVRFWLNLAKVVSPGLVSLGLFVASANFLLGCTGLLLLIAAGQMYSNRSQRLIAVEGHWRHFQDGVGILRSNKWMLPLFFWSGVASAFWLAGYQFLGPLASPDVLGADRWGFFVSAVAFGMVTGSLLASRVTFRRPLLVAVVAMWVWPISLVLLGFGPSWMAYLGAVLSGAALDIAAICVDSTVQAQVAVAALGRVNSVQVSIYLATTPLAYGLAWACQELIGPVTGIVLAGAGMLVAAGVLSVFMKGSLLRVRSGSVLVAD